MAAENNGGGEGAPHTQSTLILTLNRVAFTMQIDGHTENLDEALCMARMAVDELEARIRAARAAAMLHTEGRIPLHFDPRGPRRT